jgi:two-component sensor histidine kinase
LITNALKHAFPNGHSGKVLVQLQKASDGGLRLVVKDNGVGVPKDIDLHTSESLGFQLLSTLAEQLDGQIEMHRGEGTTFILTFPMVS